MRRREFIAGLGSAAAWPRVALAQQSQVPEVQVPEVKVPQAQTAVLGLLNGVSFEGPYAAPVTAIRQGVAETGDMDGAAKCLPQHNGGRLVFGETDEALMCMLA